MKSLINYLLIAASTAALTSCHDTQQKKQENKPVKVSVQQIQKTNRMQELDYSATIEADNTAQIGFAVSGIVNKINVEEGQTVSQGQFLAGLDETSFSSSLQIANSKYAQTQDLFGRQNELYKKGSLPAKDYTEIKAQLEQASANKRISAKELSDCRLYAPMTGIITEKLIERGSSAGPGIAAFKIIKTDMVYAKITVPESEIGVLKKGMDAEVFVPTLNSNLKGKITIINPQADDKSKAYTVKIRLNNSKQLLLPGMLADVKIYPSRTEDVIIIPASAVVRDADDLTYVFVTNADKKAVRKRIAVGKVTGKQEITVESGLSEQEVVITSGLSRLNDGSSITF